MVDSISSTNSTGGALTQAMTGGKTMGRDEFLTLLVAQLKNQDPLKPQENSAFVAELAQFSSLEQAIGMNDRLDMLALQQRGLANSQVVSMVGQQATVKGAIVSLEGNGVGTQVAFELEGNTESTTITIANQAGQIVRTIEVGARPEGLTTITWDGRDNAGNVQPKGPYAVAVSTKGANGSPVGVTQQTTAVIDSVSFDQGYPVLHLENGVSVPVADLIRVQSPTPPLATGTSE